MIPPSLVRSFSFPFKGCHVSDIHIHTDTRTWKYSARILCKEFAKTPIPSPIFCGSILSTKTVLVRCHTSHSGSQDHNIHTEQFQRGRHQDYDANDRWRLIMIISQTYSTYMAAQCLFLIMAFMWYTVRIFTSWGLRILNPEFLKRGYFWGFEDPKSWKFRI